jgi:hypothetical protein
MIAALLFLFCACQPADQIDKSDRVETGLQNRPKAATQISWIDTVLQGYVLRTDNELVRQARKQQLHEERIFDRAENRDSKEFLVYQVGHDVTDAGGANPRFVTDVWLYADTVGKKLFEYDLPNDSLMGSR